MKKLKKIMLAMPICFLNIALFPQAPLAPVLMDGFELWSGTPMNPSNWMAPPATTISPNSVTQVVTINPLYPVQSGNYSCKLINSLTGYTGMGYNNTAPTIAGEGYKISYYARGKGTITAGVTNGSSSTSHEATAEGVSIKGSKWHHVIQSIIAPATSSSAQFFLKVKNTGTYTNSSGANITGIDVDSFVVQSYTPVSNVSLYDIQYTTSASGDSPFFGQYVGKTGGIVTAVSKNTLGQPDAYYLQNSFNNTWAAILVFDQTHAAHVQIGDSVTIQAEVDEFFGMTQLQQVKNFTQYPATGTIFPNIITTQQVNQEMHESTLVGVGNATCQSYTVSYGQWKAADASTVPVVIDNKTMYPFTPTVGSVYCVDGPVNYEFSAFNIVPRFSSDVQQSPCAAGLEKYREIPPINIFPNPFSDFLDVKFSETIQNGTAILNDIQGKEVNRIIFSGTSISLDTTPIPAGMYFLKIISEAKSYFAKVVK